MDSRERATVVTDVGANRLSGQIDDVDLHNISKWTVDDQTVCNETDCESLADFSCQVTDAGIEGLFYSDGVARRDIGLGDGGYIHCYDVRGAVGITTYSLIGLVHRIGESVTPRLVLRCEQHIATIGIELEGGMQL